MDFSDVVRGRRSVRRFSGKSLGEGQVSFLLEAASVAPSAGNVQSCEVVLVRDEKLRAALSVAALSQDFVGEAAVVFVFCANQKRAATFYGDRGASLYSLMDAAAAVENLLLAAFDLGLGACWVGAFDEKKVRGLLKLPVGVRPVALVPVGYGNEKPRVPEKNLIVHEEVW